MHGRSTSARRPRRPITLVPSSKGISAEHQHQSRNGPTRLSLGQFRSTLALPGTHTLKQTVTGWRWCNAGMLDTPATISTAPVASLLCSSRSDGILCRNEEPSPVFHIALNLVDVPAADYLQSYNARKGNATKFRVPYARTVAYRHSFFPDVTRM